MKIVNDITVKEITFKDLGIGDTFLFFTKNGNCDEKDVYVRMYDIIDDKGCTMNAFRLRCNCCALFSKNTRVKKVDCIVNVIGMSN